MIISNLNYLEKLSEKTDNVKGGGYEYTVIAISKGPIALSETKIQASNAPTDNISVSTFASAANFTSTRLTEGPTSEFISTKPFQPYCLCGTSFYNIVKPPQLEIKQELFQTTDFLH
ncbi:hypothetical protein [Dapis sp. BLCC M229]|uniref:hypothetical protein n=1 Tax=Dapis sp. BLCC M229 TaxID=3400188 RepID=UPI003CEB03DB